MGEGYFNPIMVSDDEVSALPKRTGLVQVISVPFAVVFDQEPGYAWNARQSSQWLKKTLLLSLSLSILGVVNHEVIAVSLPNRESFEFLESEGHVTDAVINFSSEECKVSGRAARQAILYSCFAIIYPGGKVGLHAYMLKS